MRRVLLHAAWIAPLAVLVVLFVLGFFHTAENAAPRTSQARARALARDRAEARDESRAEPRERRAVGAQALRANVEVTVVDLEGRPVSGAGVEARAEADLYERAGRPRGRGEVPGDDWGGSSDDDDDDDDDGERRRVVVETATTDASGVANFAVWAEVELVFFARDADGRAGASSLREFREPDPENGPRDRYRVRIEIGSQAILTGRITDLRGAPVAGAEVFVDPLSQVELDDGVDTPGTVAIAAPDGRYRVALLAGGAFDVDVYADGFLIAGQMALQVLAGRETVRDFTLRPAGRIDGVVLDPRGKPVGDVPVIAVPEGKEVDFWEGYNTGRWEGGTNTEDDGTFIFDRLEPGRYVISVETKAFQPAELFDVPTGGRDVVVLRVGDGSRIRGTVTVLDPAVLKTASRPSNEMLDQWGGADEWDEDEAEPVPEAADRGPRPRYAGHAYLAAADEPIPWALGVPRGRERQSPSGLITSKSRRVADIALDEKGSGQLDVRGIPAGTYNLTLRIGSALMSRRIEVPNGATVDLALALPDASGAPTSTPAPTPRPTEEEEWGAAEDDDDDWGTSDDDDDDDDSHDPAEDEPIVWLPDVTIRTGDYDVDDAGSVIVTAAASVPRLFGGDHVVAVDDVSVTGEGVYRIRRRFEGPKGSLCRISVKRPSTGETLTASLPREKEVAKSDESDESDDDGW